MFFGDKSSDDERHDGGGIVDSEGKGYMNTEALPHCGIHIQQGGEEKCIVMLVAGESRKEKILGEILDIGQS